MMRDDTPQPFPDALLGIQLRRGGGLSLEHEPSLCCLGDGLYGRPLMRLPPVMDHQRPLAGILRHQVLQERRPLPLAPCRAHTVVGPPSQRRHGAIDLYRGLGIPGGDRGHLILQAP
jgi:hypothetical protein